MHNHICMHESFHIQVLGPITFFQHHRCFFGKLEPFGSTSFNSVSNISSDLVLQRLRTIKCISLTTKVSNDNLQLGYNFFPTPLYKWSKNSCLLLLFFSSTSYASTFTLSWFKLVQATGRQKHHLTYLIYHH